MFRPSHILKLAICLISLAIACPAIAGDLDQNFKSEPVAYILGLDPLPADVHQLREEPRPVVAVLAWIRRIVCAEEAPGQVVGHRLNRPGSYGGSIYWIPTPAGSASWPA